LESGAEVTEPPLSAEPPANAKAGAAMLPSPGAKRRRTQYGLTLRFERRPENDEPGRLVENTMWVNEAHPAFHRAMASRSLGYHLAVTVALSLAPLAVAPEEEHVFVTRFLAEWGAVNRRTLRRQSRSRRGSVR
jgi:hypothetical protein